LRQDSIILDRAAKAKISPSIAQGKPYAERLHSGFQCEKNRDADLTGTYMTQWKYVCKLLLNVYKEDLAEITNVLTRK
jgi:hypothetical protein